MPDSFFVAPDVGDKVSVGDATDAFARELQARFGPDAVQNVYQHSLSSSTAVPTTTTTTTAAKTTLSRPVPVPKLSLPPLLKALPVLPTAPTSVPSAAASSTATTTSGATLPLTASDITFTPVGPDELAHILGDCHALIIDIRPRAQYANARLPNALSLSVPSTLLKRPLFSLERLAEMLPSAARQRLEGWSHASRVLVYDADTAQVGAGGNMYGLLCKFSGAGCTPQMLCWLKGGFQAVWRSHRELVDADPPSDDEEEADNSGDEPGAAISLRGGNLPLAAFTQISTTSQSSAAASTQGRPAAHMAANPFFDSIRQNTELSHGISERIPLRLDPTVRARAQRDLPFQWLRDIARRSDIGAPSTDADEGAEALAMQFYRIELAEQRRLTGIMQHHSTYGGKFDPPMDKTEKEGDGDSTDPNSFPYSITAGFEKGVKNRYRNIWPFEHARVRLRRRSSSEEDDDYVNASYVQPLGTDRRYIATQGPLPATFTDFWTLCWQQNVHIIVMLTREVEGAMVKCGHYWADGSYGPLRLRLVSTTGTPELNDARKIDEATGGYFAPTVATPKSDNVARVRRTFELSHTSYPEAKPRIVTQFQYLAWPDMNVPEDPQGLLDLVCEVDELVETQELVEAVAEKARARDDMHWKGDGPEESERETGIVRHTLEHRPILLHCSAGVGRSGGFIAVDAVLDGLKRELRRQREAVASNTDSDSMAVDDADESDDAKNLIRNGGAAMEVDASVPGTSQAGSSAIGPSARNAGHHPRSSPSKPATPASPSGGPSRRSRRPSGSMPWSKNDPRRAPLRKWLTSTADARTGTAHPSSSSSSLIPGMEGKLDVVSPAPVQAAPPMAPLLAPLTMLSTSPFPHSDASTPQSSEAPPRAETLPISSAAQRISMSDRSRTQSAPAAAAMVLGASSDGGVVRTRQRQRSGGAKLRKAPSTTLGSSAMSSSLAPSVFSSEVGESDTSRTTPPTAQEQPSDSNGEPSRIKDRTDELVPKQPREPSPAPTIAHTTAPSMKVPLKRPTTGGARGAGLKIPLPTEVSVPTTFDYTAPRELHTREVPMVLSAYDEPVRQVVEDMREQRMSLCQSLRQYVFVHQAIIEGALRLVDAERGFVGGAGTATATAAALRAQRAADKRRVRSQLAPASGSGTGTTSSSATLPAASELQSSVRNKAKRRRSPTEAGEERKKGGNGLSKRPSLKRPDMGSG